MPPKNKTIKYIAIEDLAVELGIIERDLRVMLRGLSPPIQRDHRDREAVPESCISSITESKSYGSAVRHALLSETRLKDAEEEGEGNSLKKRREGLLNKYQPLIAEVERIHRKYIDSANEAGLESAGMAVYLLLSRVISTLKMAHDCLRNGHWYSGSLLREIDEAWIWLFTSPLLRTPRLAILPSRCGSGATLRQNTRYAAVSYQGGMFPF